jgi:hypothetical protein
MLPGGHFFMFRGSQRSGAGQEILSSHPQTPALSLVVQRIQQRLALQASGNTSAKG